MSIKLYNPLDRFNLAKSIETQILKQPVVPLKSSVGIGAGVYVLYYRGDHLPYASLSEANATEWVKPIYVGKAIPEGSRKGGYVEGAAATSKAFAKRLGEHRRKIQRSSQLNIDHFWVRMLPLEDIWIPLGESIVIDTFRPLWNVAVDGFGNNARGGGRKNQRYSAWEVLHPPKVQGEVLLGGRATVDAVLGLVEDHFANRPLRRLPSNVSAVDPSSESPEEA